MNATVVRQARQQASRRALITICGLSILLIGLFLFSLSWGERVYSPADVFAVIAGQDVPGASFSVGELRLPRALLAVLSGAAFGIAGVTFQTMLRNPLASPDIIGITHGANVAALFLILVVGASGLTVSFGAVIAGVGTALGIYLLAARGGVVGTRLILIGIGVAAMLNSATLYLLVSAEQWDLQGAMRWITGSLNLSTWDDVTMLGLAALVLVPVVLALGRDLSLLRLGDDAAAGLGVPVERSRTLLVVSAVALAAFATAATGPISFVSFMAGPIAVRLIGPRGTLIIPAALTGAVLVLTADLVGQFLFEHRYPVGVVTGALGAPFLVYLLIRTQRTGGAL